MIESKYTFITKWLIFVTGILLGAMISGALTNLIGMPAKSISGGFVSIIITVGFTLLYAQLMSLYYPKRILIKEDKIMLQTLFKRKYYKLEEVQMRQMRLKSQGEYWVSIKNEQASFRFSKNTHINTEVLRETLKKYI